jgi:hypothetical protein
MAIGKKGSSGLGAGALLLAAFAAQQTACSSATEAPASRPVGLASPSNTSSELGSLGMQLILPSGVSLETIQWVITSSNGSSVQSGSVSLTGSLTVAFVVANLASGNYTISLTATSTSTAGSTCSGSAKFSIAARMTSVVLDLLQCTSANVDAGSAAVMASAYACASIGGVSVMPSETTVGGTVTFDATANGPITGALTYAWSAPSGSFASPNSSNTTFTCSAVGTVPVTLTVGDSTVPEGGSCDPKQTTQTFQVQCDPGYCATGAMLTASPAQVPVGQSTTLIAVGVGVNPATLGYTWTASSSGDAGTVGTLGASRDKAAGPTDTTTFSCTAPGTATVTVTADDGPVPDGGVPCNANIATASTTVICK